MYIEKRKEKWVGLGLDTYKWLISEQGEKKKHNITCHRGNANQNLETLYLCQNGCYQKDRK